MRSKPKHPLPPRETLEAAWLALLKRAEDHVDGHLRCRRWGRGSVVFPAMAKEDATHAVRFLKAFHARWEEVK